MVPKSSDKITEEVLINWYVACDPNKPLSGPDDRDGRYFDLSRFETDDGRIVSLWGKYERTKITRAIDWAAKQEGQSCQLFSGYSGTGKTTELNTLANLLEDQGYAVLLADFKDYHNLSHELAIEDLMVIVAAALGEKVDERLQTTSPSYWERFKDFCEQDVELQGLTLPAGVMDLKIGLAHDKSFWQKMRGALALSLGKLRDDSHAYIRRCVARIRQVEPDRKGVVLIVDSLEKLRSTRTDQFNQVMESVLQVLRDSASFLRLPECHVIYAVPPYVDQMSAGVESSFDGMHGLLPAVKVLERGPSDQLSEDGVRALVRLLELRFPVHKVFGEDLVLLRRLIVQSGGHVRQLLTYCRDLLLQARDRELPPSAEDIEDVLRPYRRRARFSVGDKAALLYQIMEQGSIEAIAEEDRADLAQLMDQYLVLCYRNGDDWYEVHPLVRDYVRETVARAETTGTDA